MRKGEERSRKRAAVLIRLRVRKDQSIGAVQIRLVWVGRFVFRLVSKCATRKHRGSAFLTLISIIPPRTFGRARARAKLRGHGRGPLSPSLSPLSSLHSTHFLLSPPSPLVPYLAVASRPQSCRLVTIPLSLGLVATRRPHCRATSLRLVSLVIG